ncbi:MAG: hypothetical protein L6R28_05615 [Planctomycetes bacterium]|nr:hypothetical protein [Planctomycetota bacterium]
MKLPARDPLPADHSPELSLFFWLASHNLAGGNPVAVVNAMLAEGSTRDWDAFTEVCGADFARLDKERNAAQSGGARPVNA